MPELVPVPVFFQDSNTYVLYSTYYIANSKKIYSFVVGLFITLASSSQAIRAFANLSALRILETKKKANFQGKNNAFFFVFFFIYS